MKNGHLKPNRRQVLAACIGALTGLMASPVFAGQPIIEIIAFAHPPVDTALKPTRQWLSQQGAKLRVIEINMESADAQARLKTLGLKGHLPIVIVIDGQYRYTKRDGGEIEFVGFPRGPGTPDGVKSNWATADLEFAVKSRL